MDFVQSFTQNGPTIIVFKGWKSPGVKLRGVIVSHTAQVAESASLIDSSQRLDSRKSNKNRKVVESELKFVNNTVAGRNKDDDVHKLVCSHVGNGFIRDARHKKRYSQRCSRISTQVSKHIVLENHVAIAPRMVGYQTALAVSEYPILMQPQFHQLLSIYIRHVTSRMYPIGRHLQFNPSLNPKWYQFAMADEAMLHGLLYAGAVYAALLEGKTESQDTVYHLSQIISIVNNRLGHSGEVQESTIGTLCCLALGEAITGHIDLWHVHMRGLKLILQARGGITSLPFLLQTKVRRTDIAAAVEHVELPYLDFYRSNQPPIWSILPIKTRTSMQEIMIPLFMAFGIHLDLNAIMRELALFSEAIRFTKLHSQILLDPDSFTEDMYWIQYKLLSFPTSLQGGVKEQGLDYACRMGALLYMKVILEELPSSATGYSILLRHLQESLDKITITDMNTPLLLWLTLIGAGLSKHAAQRTWFVTHLALLMTFVSAYSFDDETLPVNKILRLQGSFGRQLERLWVDVAIVRDRNAAYQELSLTNPPYQEAIT